MKMNNPHSFSIIFMQNYIIHYWRKESNIGLSSVKKNITTHLTNTLIDEFPQ